MTQNTRRYVFIVSLFVTALPSVVFAQDEPVPIPADEPIPPPEPVEAPPEAEIPMNASDQPIAIEEEAPPPPIAPIPAEATPGGGSIEITPADPSAKPLSTVQIVEDEDGQKKIIVTGRAPAGKQPYLGVQPGINDYIPETTLKPGDVPRVTWLGFQMKEATARIFIQSTSPVRYQVIPGKSPNQLIVEIPDSKLRTRNDAHSLDARHFPTAIISAKARSRRGVTRVTINLKQPVEHTHHQEGNYIFLDFQAPSTASPAPAFPATPSPEGS